MILAAVAKHTPTCPIKAFYLVNEESQALDTPLCKACNIDVDAIDKWDENMRFSELFRRFNGRPAIDIAQGLGWTVSESKGYWTLCSFGN